VDPWLIIFPLNLQYLDSSTTQIDVDDTVLGAQISVTSLEGRQLHAAKLGLERIRTFDPISKLSNVKAVKMIAGQEF
jgi:hypothetical protein